MEKLELKTNEFTEDCDLRCKGWCHDIDLRCKGWCHDIEMPYTIQLPGTEYFS